MAKNIVRKEVLRTIRENGNSTSRNEIMNEGIHRIFHELEAVKDFIETNGEVLREGIQMANNTLRWLRETNLTQAGMLRNNNN